MRNTEEDSGDP